MTAFFQAISTENYPEAKRQADALIAKVSPEDRLKISVAYPRVLLGLGLHEPARQYLAAMGQQPLPGNAQAVIEVYAAWLEAMPAPPVQPAKRGRAKPTPAAPPPAATPQINEAGIKKLESILEKNGRDLATAEAADVLAMFYMAQGKHDDARRAVDFGLATLDYASLIGKTDYTETLLRNRLSSNIASPEAEKLYAAAEELFSAGKFTEAGPLYQKIVAEHPRSQWAAPAQFRIGGCLLGLNRPQEAYKHWQLFIETAPTGPWRGQAHVAMIDLALEKNLDLKLATEYALAATSVVVSLRETNPLAEREAYNSWQAAAHDIHLRQGIVALVESRYEAAATALKNVAGTVPVPSAHLKSTSPSHELRHGDHAYYNIANPNGLARLTQAAEKRQPLLPDELAAGEARTVAALALGNVYCVLNDYTTAQKYFALILSGRSRSSSAPHRSFALFGMARTVGSLPSQDKSQTARYEEVKALCKQSWDEYPKGSWHDETLFRTAMVIDYLANVRHNAAQPAEEPANKNPMPKDRKAAAKAQIERHAAFAKARREALPFWHKIIKDYSNSPRCQQAYYMAGVLQIDIGNWQEGLPFLDRFVQEYPAGAYSGEALLILGQHALEDRVDMAASRRYLENLDHWIIQTRKRGRAPSAPPAVFTPTPSESPHDAPPVEPKPKDNQQEGQRIQLSGGRIDIRPRYGAEALDQCHHEAWYLDSTELACAKLLGFLHFVKQEKDEALAQYEKIHKLDPEARAIAAGGEWSDYTRLKWGLDHGYLYAYPEELDRYEGDQRLAVLLADFYYCTQRFEDSAVLAQRLLKGEFGPLKAVGTEYPQYLYASSIYWTRGRTAAFPEYLKVLGNKFSLDDKNLSFTKQRAAYAAGNISLEMPNGLAKQQGKEILRQLATSGKMNQFALQARIGYAAALINEGNRAEGMHLLETFPESSNGWRTIALHYVKSYREAEQNALKAQLKENLK